MQAAGRTDPDIAVRVFEVSFRICLLYEPYASHQRVGLVSSAGLALGAGMTNLALTLP
jgi:hypothetical protein